GGSAPVLANDAALGLLFPKSQQLEARPPQFRRVVAESTVERERAAQRDSIRPGRGKRRQRRTGARDRTGPGTGERGFRIPRHRPPARRMGGAIAAGHMILVYVARVARET